MFVMMGLVVAIASPTVFLTDPTTVVAMFAGASALEQQGVSSVAWSYQDSHTGADLHGIWGASANDVFAVGDGGVIVHYDGQTWSTQQSGTRTPLQGVCGTSSSDVFAVGRNGTVLHYDGTRWTTQQSGTTADLEDVFCASSSAIFAVGEKGTTAQFDGQRWTAQQVVPARDEGFLRHNMPARLMGVSGGSANDVIAVGGLSAIRGSFSENGVIVRYDGHQWSYEKSEALFDVWNTPEDGSCAAGSRKVLCRSGKDQTRDLHPAAYLSGPDRWFHPTIVGIWGRSASDLFVVTSTEYWPTDYPALRPTPWPASVLHYDGSKWLPEMFVDKRYGLRYPSLSAIWGASPGEVFAVGESGAILHRTRDVTEPIFVNRRASDWIPQLKDKNRGARRTAAAALLAIGQASVVPALVDALEDQDDVVRRRAASALGNLGAAAADSVSALRDLIAKETKEDVRRAAEQAVQKIGVRR